ncbi:hypothetical protein Moror_5857 [Moniliophthora roreri MCA 2997]|uniref:Uncharacterized protein n=1 Tax=Moniliophthora roreri (strain MCA 2997) TaxID=1381753 RepID=V2X348_MONRO|nr:hypothetical protein Moror_5857 [Moniliophthora roreri MCA 2997]
MMPLEVTKPILKILQENSQGFTLTLDGKEYYFPNANCGPSELYLTHGYSVWSHTNDCYTCFAFNISAGHEQIRTATSGKVHILSYGGANFVDVNLHVVVVNEAATLFAFNPAHVHGTTVTGGTINYHLTYAFSLHIEEALKKLKGGTFLGERK